MKKVIINADDYGIIPPVTRGILTAWDAGAITSTTVVGNACSAEDLRTLRHSGLTCGLHLDFVEGRPLTGKVGLEAILTDDGVFAGMYRLAWAVIRKRVSVERLRQEMQAQADVLLDAGLTVGHIDSHWHMHHLPVISEAVVQVAQRVGAGAVRVSREPLAFAPAMLKPTAKKALMLPFVSVAARKFRRHGLGVPRAFFGISLLDLKDPATLLKRTLSRLPDGVTEIAVHISEEDPSIRDTWYRLWPGTLQALLQLDVPRRLADSGIEATSFAAEWGARNQCD
ncbi:MAG: ChbG/HpnK family deacetylase [Phycisphaerae bacterium]|nr:ChbG/HpnK family deacetylase [Phycisphaerae bacterium]